VRLVGAWLCTGRNEPWRYDRQAHNGTFSACYRPRSIVRPAVQRCTTARRCMSGARDSLSKRDQRGGMHARIRSKRLRSKGRSAEGLPGPVFQHRARPNGRDNNRVGSCPSYTVSSYTTLPRRSVQRFCVAPHVRPPAFLSTRTQQKAPGGVVSATTTAGAQVERNVDANVYCRTGPQYPRD